MKFVLTLIPALLLSSVALSQEVAEESAKDLWCGLAFGIISAEAPTDVNEQQQALVKQYTDGGLMLVDRAKVAHLASGFTEETFAAHVETLSAEVNTQVHAAGNTATYSFEECSALIGL
jgi:hypothetical protein